LAGSGFGGSATLALEDLRAASSSALTFSLGALLLSRGSLGASFGCSRLLLTSRFSFSGLSVSAFFGSSAFLGSLGESGLHVPVITTKGLDVVGVLACQNSLDRIRTRDLG
jgi:hypothetical protein